MRYGAKACACFLPSNSERAVKLSKVPSKELPHLLLFCWRCSCAATKSIRLDHNRSKPVANNNRRCRFSKVNYFIPLSKEIRSKNSSGLFYFVQNHSVAVVMKCHYSKFHTPRSIFKLLGMLCDESTLKAANYLY